MAMYTESESEKGFCIWMEIAVKYVKAWLLRVKKAFFYLKLSGIVKMLSNQIFTTNNGRRLYFIF